MFYDVFVMLCNQKGISLSRAAEDIRLNRAAVAKWKKGAIPGGDTLSKLSDYFEVPIEYLLTGKENAPTTGGDDELQEYLEELRSRPEKKALLSITKNATKEQIEASVKIVDAYLESIGVYTKDDDTQ